MTTRTAARSRTVTAAARHEVPGRLGRRRARIVGPVAWAAALALCLAAAGALPTLATGSMAQTASTVTVQVRPSDSLWSIATAHAEGGATTAAMVERISRLNSLRGPRLLPGQRLIVPVPYGARTTVSRPTAEDATR